MKTGKIYQSLSGFYDVNSDGQIYRTRARGNFRKRLIKPLVGDEVEFDVTNGTEGYILKIMPRKNSLVRPPIANTGQAIVVVSVIEPDFSEILLDKELVALEKEHITPIIYFSKLDLVSEKQVDYFSQIARDYENKVGYQVIYSPDQAKNFQVLRDLLKNKQSVIMGQTGAGKSTLLNHLDPSLNLETGEVSKALSRGKHTTRKVSFLTINNGIIADTPGFSSFEAADIKLAELKNYFPEFVRVANECKFRECSHINEPGCAVKKGVENGTILTSRYDDYLKQYALIKSQKIIYKRKRGNKND
ncbi:ribosome small subunit-dependent GTPase A [Fructilactobacillus sanfranciscensis]|uniref:ribosome small subunit-dependent GTPase A n=1 Tax=Fructilactobacillus sanfranciscensis TaxID=1625 RepID=UPI0013D0A305|nr:ribosome small subunit-dependent GTPase A [Fructilactobacillus sanfranciscensis]MCG7194181.1 ribosome small subunit-dependent GTPase A [Fructilactobacillus sanfranciscensis]NDR97276.1 ribosome small subunit-dependent GTPase A [Fructilactobacillus sanfranciscensis]